MVSPYIVANYGIKKTILSYHFIPLQVWGKEDIKKPSSAEHVLEFFKPLIRLSLCPQIPFNETTSPQSNIYILCPNEERTYEWTLMFSIKHVPLRRRMKFKASCRQFHGWKSLTEESAAVQKTDENERREAFKEEEAEDLTETVKVSVTYPLSFLRRR